MKKGKIRNLQHIWYEKPPHRQPSQLARPRKSPRVWGQVMRKFNYSDLKLLSVRYLYIMIVLSLIIMAHPEVDRACGWKPAPS